MKKVAVIFGGESESEISKMSSDNVCNCLEKLGFEFKKIEFSKDLPILLKEYNPDVVYNSMHGTFGEDGCVSGLCEIMKVPYTHSGVVASAIGMDKVKTQQVLKSSGKFDDFLSDYVVVSGKDIKNGNFLKTAKDSIKSIYGELKTLFVKPVNEGSSFGCFSCDVTDVGFKSNVEIKDNLQYLVQERIFGTEISSAVLDNKVIGSGIIKCSQDYYDYHAKYFDKNSGHLFDFSGIENEIKKAEEASEFVHNFIGASCLSRSDFILTKDVSGKSVVKFLEINTHPGFTSASIINDIYSKVNKVSLEEANLEIVKVIISDARLSK